MPLIPGGRDRKISELQASLVYIVGACLLPVKKKKKKNQPSEVNTCGSLTWHCQDSVFTHL